ncbi:glycosyltransferase family 4 protein [Photobacterium sanguinicancri]|uniref:Glycosyltransferase family 4 protein n=1 Tax=Photobacterium sanguinicancri TaxID=875932 RepID=A0AAW7Y0T4_9GAMM|nr:glycosyltransferase family 4 protein [Photobacterium sanguinicancri]MDO6542034.1 glycosyltransferase family 4 protein [Photobacterium sanguinicancri]
MNILTISTLFPNSMDPKHGVFVETRLKHLKKHYPDVNITVIAPVPWFPFKSAYFGQYSLYANTPQHEQRNGFEVYHPRYLVIPKIGMTLTPVTLAHSIEKQIQALLDQGLTFDAIDGHYFYPDGVAINQVAKRFNIPYTVTARGTDINLIPQFSKPKRQIQQVLQDSNHNMAVCEALRQEMLSLGAEPQKVSTLRNGVDLDLFQFSNEDKQQQLREELDLPADKTIVISVGWLIERKGHHHVIRAINDVPNAILLIAGNGPEDKKLKQLVTSLGLEGRVHFLSQQPQPMLCKYYGAADTLVLASSREGWANVLLEAMACGTPVVATKIWGSPEVVQHPHAGVLVDREPQQIAKAINQLSHKTFTRLDTRKYAEQFDWQSTSDKQYALFSELVN